MFEVTARDPSAASSFVLRERALGTKQIESVLAFARIYDEWGKWGRLALISHETIKEYASIVGHSRCFSSVPNFSLSPHFRSDARPWDDRHPLFGNAIVELVK